MKNTTLAAMALSLMLTAADAVASTPKGVDRANLNETVAPGTDFYDYACGGWMAANPLTDEYSRYGTFDQLGELNRQQVRDLILGLDATKEAPGTNARKIADLYAMGMDSLRLNREGSMPVQADLLTIANTPRGELINLLATIPGADGFFGTYVEADMLDANSNVMYWMQGGLGLGDRDYYLENSENTRKVLMAYRNYLYTLAKLIGKDDATAYDMVGNAIAIERTLAEAAMSREELRDPAASYNPMTMADVAQKYPAVNLAGYFKALGIDKIENLIVGQPKSLEAVNEILANYDEQAIRDYMTLMYLQNAAPYLSDDFIAANFEMSRAMSGVNQPQPRWKRAMGVPNGMMGEAVGELYVAQYFPPVAKEKMTTLVKNLQTALGQHIQGLAWMSDATKARALEKLAAFTVKIGYPDTWIDYSALNIDPSKSYWNNVQSAIKFNADRNTADFGKPVDRDRWYMSPQTVNAYYNPGTNEICFPAGILQAPFFNPDADDAENYGAIGVVIGHEMTHGFDDQGRQFDKDGNFSNWWTDEDAAAFNALADALATQFDAIEVAPGVHANGRFTLGENIADQGGLRVAYTAYHNALAQSGNAEGEVIDGFTPDQRFYLAYADVWAGNIREAEILKRTKTDPHSLGRWRVNASLRNIAPFFEAFNITEGEPMFRPVDERVVIW